MTYNMLLDKLMIKAKCSKIAFYNELMIVITLMHGIHNSQCPAYELCDSETADQVWRACVLAVEVETETQKHNRKTFLFNEFL